MTAPAPRKNRRLSRLGAKTAWIGLGLAILFLATEAWTQDLPVGRQVLPGHFRSEFAQAPLVGKLDDNIVLHLAISLPVPNRSELDSISREVSNPKSPNYQHFLTPEQTAKKFGADEKDYQALIAFAESHGLSITARHRNRLLLSVSGSVAAVNAAFHVQLTARRRPDGSIFYAPDREPSVDLETKILHVAGLENFVLPKHAGHGWSGSGPGGSFQPPDIRNAYVPHTGLTGRGQIVGLFEFDGYYTAVIQKYQQQFNINVPVKNVLNDGFVETSSQSGPPQCGCSPTLACFKQALDPINPPPPAGTPGGGQGETTLDIYMAMTMAPGLSSIYVYEGCNADDILAAMEEQNSDGGFPLQLSSSYQWWPIDASQSQTLALMAVHGQTFLMAAGDNTATCPVGQEDVALALPNVTIVGGTILEMKDHGMSRLPETAATDGGGVLIGVPQPDYQQQGLFGSIAGGSTQWRMIPDVSMVSCDGGPCGMFGYQQSNAGVIPSCCATGTSAATPLWAGFVAMINEKRATRGKCMGAGFLNPTLYAIGDLNEPDSELYHQNFHDITKGSSPAASLIAWPFGCQAIVANGAKLHLAPAGVATSAAPGFDLVTGLGTPKPHLIDELAPPLPPNTAACPCDLFWCPRLNVCTDAMICGYDLPPSPTAPGN